MEPLLTITGLRMDIEGTNDCCPIVKDIDLTVNRGEVVALIGESGSGKTTICLSAMGYVRAGLKISSGKVYFDGIDVFSLRGDALRDLRGKRIAYVAQSAAAAFNPGLNIGSQVKEPALIHRIMPKKEASVRAIDLYEQFKLPDAENIGRRFPHQVSGGQLQRLMAAMAMCCGPEMIVFDEPTTALDVTTQIDVLKSFKDVIRSQGVAAIYVTHNLAVVAQIADRIIVLLNGEIKEQGNTDEIISSPKNEYTQMLMAACDPDSARARACKGLMEVRASASDRLSTSCSGSLERKNTKELLPQKILSLLQVKNVTAGYGGTSLKSIPKSIILKNINLEVKQKSITGVIGESGSGKTTLGRVLAGLLPLAAGEIRLDGKLLKPSVTQRKRDELRRIQMVFQMADTALNPAHTIEKILGRPIEYFQGFTGEKKKEQVGYLLEMVQLPRNLCARRPQELSGGQKQRINLARAIAANPQLIICDEVTSGLDTVVRMSIIDLIRELHSELGVSFLFISHDISTIATLANEIIVMYQGKIVEQGLVDYIMKHPMEPYTKILMTSVPHLRTGWLEEAIGERNTFLESAIDLKILSAN
jgi:peptide/nickel transport system ATP-binding protein